MSQYEGRRDGEKWGEYSCILGAVSMGFSNCMNVDCEAGRKKDDVWVPNWTVGHPSK